MSTQRNMVCPCIVKPIVQAEGPNFLGRAGLNWSFSAAKHVDPSQLPDGGFAPGGYSHPPEPGQVAVAAGQALGALEGSAGTSLPGAQMDETIVQMLHEKNRSAQFKSYVVREGTERKGPSSFSTTIPRGRKRLYRHSLPATGGMCRRMGMQATRR